MSSVYENGAYLLRHPTWHVEDARFKAQRVTSVIRGLDLPAKTICEVGCGTGAVAQELSAAFPKSSFFCYDISEHAIRLSSNSENCSFFVGQPTVGSYDIAMCLDVIEHVENVFGFLRDLKSRANYKIFHIPIEMSALAVAINNPVHSRINVGHLHYFSADTALSTLRECGYEILHESYTPIHVMNFSNLFVGGDMGRKFIKLALLGLPRFLLSCISETWAARLLGGFSLLVVAR